MSETKYGESVLDAMLTAISGAASLRLLLVPLYDRADTYGDVDAKWIAEKANPTFQTIIDDPGGDADAKNRRLPVDSVVFDDARTGNTEGTDLCQMLVSGTEILAVSNETSSPQRGITAGDSITSFAFYCQASQPAQV
jgi:hypothetical protein